MRRSLGFTLWELLCVLAIAAVTLSVGIPALAGLALDARRTADVNGLVAAVQLARSEAAKRGRAIVLCTTPDFQQCSAHVSGSGGWMVFEDVKRERPPRRSPAEPVLLAHRASVESISANRQWFELRPFQRRSTNGTITLCDRRGSAAARAVIVSYTGRPRVSAVGPAGRALECGAAP